MKKNTLIYMLFFIFTISTLFCSSERSQTIIDFEDSLYAVTSFSEEQDLEPDNWVIDSVMTEIDSTHSLKIFGNSWKVIDIDSTIVNEDDIWQISAYFEFHGEIHGFGLKDSTNVLLYSLSGSEMLNIEEWVTAYQGHYPDDMWHQIQLPVADDWFARYDYFPVVTQLIFINDCDNDDNSVVYFDNVLDVTEDIPVIPIVEISYSRNHIIRNRDGSRDLEVQFECAVIDSADTNHVYLWDFGDGETSDESDPIHTFTIQDGHEYTVFLAVENSFNLTGYAAVDIAIDDGPSTLPITMNFVGDVMLGRGMENVIWGQGIESIFNPTLDVLGNAANITIANLECPLTNQGSHHPTKPIYFRADPSTVDGLVYAGIDIVSLANNHTLDYGIEGLVQTQEVLEEYNIIHSGAGLNSREAYEPVFWNQSGVNVAFLASSDRTGQYNNYQPYLNAGYNTPGFAYMTPYYVQEQINSVRDVADFVVMEFHAGSEYSLAPGSDYDKGYSPEDVDEEEDYSPRADVPHVWDEEMRHLTVDSGADLVICHHPHIIQGVELYEGKLIAHSLGNFVFDLSYHETFPSMILQAELNEDGFNNFSIIPIYIDDYIPRVATGELGTHILNYLARRSREMNTILEVDTESNIANVIMEPDLMQIYENEVSQLASLTEIDGEYISAPIKLPRNGNISNLEINSTGCEYRLGRSLLWYGNFEDEGSTQWNTNSSYEEITDEVAYNGLRSLHHHQTQSSSGVETFLENRIKTYSDQAPLTLDCYIKTSNAFNVTVNIVYYYYRTGSYEIGSENLGTLINGDTDWQHYFKNLNIPENAWYVDIYPETEISENDQISEAWFDDLDLIQWEPWRTTQEISDFNFPNDYYYLQIKSATNQMLLPYSFIESGYEEIPVSNEDFNNLPSFSKGKLYQNRPNPFVCNNLSRSSTDIYYQIENKGNVEINFYNLKGQKVNQVTEGKKDKGIWKISWDGTNSKKEKLSSGVYFYQLKINNEVVDTKKCLIIK